MPWTLWRYILRELWRLVLLSTAVLVTVIAFAATVKPLADGKLTPMEALHFMALAIPPMLAFALPFAAGFATTLGYHRLTQDNEFIAARSAGVSHRSFVMPAVMTGLVLAVGLMLLNEQVIPRFLRSMEGMIRRNLIQVMVRTIERGEAAEFADLQIHAERIKRIEPEAGTGVLDQYLMMGVTAVGFDKAGIVETDLSARQAHLWLVPASVAGIDDTDEAVALVRFEDWWIKDRGGLYRQETFTLAPVRIPNPFEDDPKFLTFGELRSLSRVPEGMNWIESQRLEVARRIAAREALAMVLESLRNQGEARFDDDQGRSIVVHAPGLIGGGWKLMPSERTGRIEVEVYHPGPGGERRGGGVDRLSVLAGELMTESPESDPTRPVDSTALRFTLRLEGVVLRSAAGLDLADDEGETERVERVFRGLNSPRDTLARLRPMRAREVIAEARTAEARFGSGVEAIARAADRLDEQIVKLRREIRSKQHERMAMAASCFVMVLTGAMTALRLRETLPLVVYLWSFFPALVTVILINTGQQVTHRMGVIGLPVMWAGVAGLCVYTFVAYRRVCRH
ncbi:MAG: LptF/LptG family permease [Phycisphaeraceae bacterium]|nr:LptF/LptG family permease [Phycisphaeraceae bacterium]MCW5763896.1 LptF/LptG family permease [Phycisphaeraceae bacterium]